MAARINSNRSLAKVNDIIARNHADFFRNRVISLNLLAKEKDEADIRDLELLMGFILIKKVDNTKFYNQLKDICIKHKINNPIVGEEFYDPSAFDLTKQKQTYSSTVTSLCQDPGAYQHFKSNRREILGFSLKKDPEILK